MKSVKKEDLINKIIENLEELAKAPYNITIFEHWAWDEKLLFVAEAAKKDVESLMTKESKNAQVTGLHKSILKFVDTMNDGSSDHAALEEGLFDGVYGEREENEDYEDYEARMDEAREGDKIELRYHIQ